MYLSLLNIMLFANSCCQYILSNTLLVASTPKFTTPVVVHIFLLYMIIAELYAIFYFCRSYFWYIFIWSLHELDFALYWGHRITLFCEEHLSFVMLGISCPMSSVYLINVLHPFIFFVVFALALLLNISFMVLPSLEIGMIICSLILLPPFHCIRLWRTKEAPSLKQRE